MKTALILIDIQNDYFPGGRKPLVSSPEASQQAARLLDHFRLRSLPVAHIMHIAASPQATFFLPDTAGIQIHAAVAPLEGEFVVLKHSPNSFLNTTLLDHLRELEVERLVAAGMMTHMCVDATVRAASDLGFEVWLAQDACATRDLDFENKTIPASHVQAAFLAALQDAYACVMPTSEILERLS
jgi:nicotinamidase-related amidase